MNHATAGQLPASADTAQASTHLIVGHGWDPDMAIGAESVWAHNYAHGNGRPDLADTHLDHTHAPSPTGGWPPPAIPPPAGYVEPTRSAGPRPLTGIILAWNALMALWVVYGIVVSAQQSASCTNDLYRDACQAGTAIGSAIGLGEILFFAVAVDIALGLIWLVTKKDR